MAAIRSRFYLFRTARLDFRTSGPCSLEWVDIDKEVGLSHGGHYLAFSSIHRYVGSARYRAGGPSPAFALDGPESGSLYELRNSDVAAAGFHPRIAYAKGRMEVSALWDQHR
jgi:hypothetical protein